MTFDESQRCPKLWAMDPDCNVGPVAAFAECAMEYGAGVVIMWTATGRADTVYEDSLFGSEETALEVAQRHSIYRMEYHERNYEMYAAASQRCRERLDVLRAPTLEPAQPPTNPHRAEPDFTLRAFNPATPGVDMAADRVNDLSRTIDEQIEQQLKHVGECERRTTINADGTPGTGAIWADGVEVDIKSVLAGTYADAMAETGYVPTGAGYDEIKRILGETDASGFVVVPPSTPSEPGAEQPSEASNEIPF